MMGEVIRLRLLSRALHPGLVMVTSLVDSPGGIGGIEVDVRAASFERHTLQRNICPLSFNSLALGRVLIADCLSQSSKTNIGILDNLTAR